jgi:hypothetical protein
MTAAELEYLTMELDGWARSHPDGAVRYRKRLHPNDDEYGAAAIYTFEPRARDACSLEVILVDGGAEMQVGLCLDTFERLAPRLDAETDMNYVALFHEPARMTTDTAMSLCRAVALGRVTVTAAVCRGRLAATRGKLLALPKALRLEGIGGPIGLFRAFAPTGLTRVGVVHYRPWSWDGGGTDGG